METSVLEHSRNGMTKSASSLSLKLHVSAERCASAATYSDAGCCCSGKASDSRKPKPNGNKPQVHGLSPLEEPTFVTLLRG